ncbi:MAG: hypothetical protein ACOX17_10050 [Christensenellales bacterium]|jgi:hypothetical protein
MDLPREKMSLLDPRQPLGEAAERYWPRPDKVLNMIRLVDGFALIASLLAFMLALAGRPEKLLTTGLLLAAASLVMAVCLLRGLRHKRGGGDARRRGFFLLEDGLLTWDGRKAQWVPRGGYFRV